MRHMPLNFVKSPLYMEISNAEYVSIYIKYGVYTCLMQHFTYVKRRYAWRWLYICLVLHFTCVKSLETRATPAVDRLFTYISLNAHAC
jgi:hypothetical protein